MRYSEITRDNIEEIIGECRCKIRNTCRNPMMVLRGVEVVRNKILEILDTPMQLVATDFLFRMPQEEKRNIKCVQVVYVDSENVSVYLVCRDLTAGLKHPWPLVRSGLSIEEASELSRHLSRILKVIQSVNTTPLIDYLMRD